MNRLISGNRSHVAAYLYKLHGDAHLLRLNPANSTSLTRSTLVGGGVGSSLTMTQTKRHMSDNLLGYNPMAGTASSNKNVGGKKEDTTTTKKKPTGPIIGVDSNTAGGGVWAQTSAKRDKLGELRLELNFDKGQRTLDDAATDEEKRDLYLIDGITAVASLVDGKAIANVDRSSSASKKFPALNDFDLILNDYQDEVLVSATGTSASANASSSENSSDGGLDSTIQIDHSQFEAHISHLLTHVDAMKLRHVAALSITEDETSSSGSDQPSATSSEGEENTPSSLIHLRDFMLFTQPTDAKVIPDRLQQDISPTGDSLSECHEYFRILLLEAVLRYLLVQWEVLLRVSDADLDRAATKAENLVRPHTMSLSKIHAVLRAFATGSCNDRVEAMWNLMDKDDDGMLDQSEMDTVVEMTLNPTEDALRAFVTDSVGAWPMRTELPSSLDDVQRQQQQDYSLQQNQEEQKKKGRYRKWMDKRKEKKAQKQFLWAMERAAKRHFDIDVETPHRLRCIYAWAEKKHQDGKLDSVLVDDGGAGRKRYVELDPKISYEEFREVQKEHFEHLDRVAEELCTSLKEELWVIQGKRRQNQELKREGLAFLTVVALIDFAIMTA